MRRSVSLPRVETSIVRGLGAACRCSTASRSGRAFLEVVLIVLVPLVGFLGWQVVTGVTPAFFSVASAANDPEIPINVVFGMVKMADEVCVSANSDGQLRWWDLKNRSLLGSLQVECTEIRSVSFARERNWIAVATASGKVEVWDIANLTSPMAKAEATERELICCAFSHDESRIIAVGSPGPFMMWDSETLKPRKVENFPNLGSDRLRSIAIVPDGRTVLLGTYLGRIIAWDLSESRVISTMEVTFKGNHTSDSMIESMLLTNNPAEVVAISRGKGMHIWNFRDNRFVRSIQDSMPRARACDLSSDGTRLAAADDDQGLLWIWDIPTGRIVKKLPIQPSVIRSLKFVGGQTSLICGDWNGKVQFVDLGNI